MNVLVTGTAGMMSRDLEPASKLLRILGRPQTLPTPAKDRPGHDRRHASDSSRIKADLKWEPTVSFKDGIAETARYYGHVG